MNSQENAAFIISQSVCAMAEIEGMKSENKSRELCGYSLAYKEKDFFDVISKYGIDHNSVIEQIKSAY